MHMQGQDWNEVVLRKKHTTTSQATSSAAVNAALRSGMLFWMRYYPFNYSMDYICLVICFYFACAGCITHLMHKP